MPVMDEFKEERAALKNAGFRDPFQGCAEPEAGILRTAGEPNQRFREDPLRILIGLHFAARFRLTIEEATWQAMLQQRHLLDSPARDQVYDELCKLLISVTTAEELGKFGPVLAAVIPELEPMIGFDQHSPHHAYDLFTHVAHVVAGVPEDLPLRWAALLHDVGKVPTFTRDSTGRGHFYGHAGVGAEMADTILRRLKAPTDLRERVVFLIEKHMTKLEPEKKVLRRWLGRLGEETIDQLLLLQEADMGSKGTGKPEEMAQFSRIRGVLEEIKAENTCLSLKDLAVNGHDLTALGFRGKAIGQMLNHLLELVLDEKLPNEKGALLTYVKQE